VGNRRKRAKTTQWGKKQAKPGPKGVDLEGKPVYFSERKKNEDRKKLGSPKKEGSTSINKKKNEAEKKPGPENILENRQKKRGPTAPAEKSERIEKRGENPWAMQGK